MSCNGLLQERSPLKEILLDNWIKIAQKQNNGTIAPLALQGGNEKLAKEALQRRQPYQNSVQKLQIEIDLQNEIVSRLKQDLLALETKIGLAKAEKNTYLIRAKSAFVREKKSQWIYESDSASILSEIEARAIESEAYSQLISSKDYDEY